jgi:Flp pilus assembly protein TadG
MLLTAVEFHPFQCALSNENPVMTIREQLMRCAPFWRCYNHTAGSQIAEFAISLPLLAVVVIGITDFGSAFDLKYKLSNAVREGARFASTQSASDLTNAVPASVTAVRDLIDSYLIGDHVNDCGLATASPVQAGLLVWSYTANTRCPGGGTLTLIVNRGKTFQTTGGVTVETTRVSISYPFQWRFSSVIRVLIRTAGYLRVTYIRNESVMQNLN